MQFNSSIVQDCQCCSTLLLSIIHNSSPYDACKSTHFGVLGHISVVAEVFFYFTLCVDLYNIQLVGSYFYHVQEDIGGLMIVIN